MSDKNFAQLPHNVIIEERDKISISGVVDVENFDENIVVIETNKGNLTVQGEGLHVEKLNLDIGEISLEGMVMSIEYNDNIKQSGSFLSRLFK